MGSFTFSRVTQALDWLHTKFSFRVRQKPKDRSLIEYSRDEMAAPLRELDRVFAAVSMNVFDPDALVVGGGQVYA